MAKKLISYDDEAEGLGLPDVVETAMDGRFNRVDVAPTGTLEGDKAAVIAAALDAKNAGRLEVKMAPGHYHLDGVNVDDIHGRYLVGDGVTFTPASHVYPFRIGEMAARSVESPMEGGRGAIAFEVDDADPSHWFSLFPLTKELGTPFGLSWITGREDTEWVKEAYRHGWELMSHLTYDTDASEISLEALDADAKATVDALEWATGTRDGHGFVYPRHVRTYETDRVLSKYFSRGRAGNDRLARPMDAPNPWGYQAFDIDGHVSGGRMSDELKDILTSVAASNSKMVFFTHWRDNEGLADRVSAFQEMIAYARSLGIAIRLPKQLMTRSQIIADPYMERDGWTKTSTGGEIDNTVAYHGTRSVKSNGTSATVQAGRTYVATRPGCFTVVRLSVRVKTDGATASSATQGIRFSMQPFFRDEHGQQTNGNMTTFLPPIVPGPTIPAQDWKRHRATMVLTPGIQMISPRWGAQNITSGELWMDEFQIDVVDYIPELVLEGSTSASDAGATTRAFNFMASDLRGLKYRVEPLDVFTGTPSINVSADSFTVVSTDSADTNKRVRVFFSPHQDHMSKAWSDQGA